MRKRNISVSFKNCNIDVLKELEGISGIDILIKQSSKYGEGNDTV